MLDRGRLFFLSLLECLVRVYLKVAGGGGGWGGRGMLPGSEGPIKITAWKLILTVHPVSVEQKPVKHRFTSAESITSSDLTMCLSSILIEHTRSMNIKLFGCEITSTKLVMFNLTVEWRFSNLGLSLDEEWRTDKPNSKFALLMALPLLGGKKLISAFPLPPVAITPGPSPSPALSCAIHQGRANHKYYMVPKPKRTQKE